MKTRANGDEYPQQLLAKKLLLNPIPDNRILDRSKFKQTADNILQCVYNEKYKCHIG